MLLATAILAMIANQVWAAQVTPTVQPIPVGETLGPENTSKYNLTGNMVVYNCSNGVQLSMPEDLAGPSGEVIVVIYSKGRAEVKIRCTLSEEQEPVLEEVKQATIASKPESLTAKITTTVTTTEQAAIQRAQPEAAPGEREKPRQEVQVTENITPTTIPSEEQAQTPTQAPPKDTVRERLMLTLLGGILAGLVAIAAWRILLA